MASSRVIKIGALAAATLVAAACGGSGGSEGQTDSLTVAWFIPPSSMDPHMNPSAAGAHPYIDLLYDRLTAIEPVDGVPTVVPSVAESWDYSADGRTLTFSLRRDVKFHDGTPLDAKAVVASMDRALHRPQSSAQDKFTMVEDVSAPGDYTVQFALDEPSTDLPFILATTLGSIVNPKAVDDDLGAHPAGSGPYELTSLTVGDKATFTRVHDYWNPDTYVIPKVEIRGIVDDNARMNALRSGQIDAALSRMSQYRDATAMAESGDFTLSTSGRTSWYTIYLNSDRGPLRDPRVRQALNYAIDRDALNDSLMNGQCAPTSQPLQEGVDGHVSEDGFGYRHDPDKARALLVEAGYTDGLEIKALTTGAHAQLSVGIQAQLQAVGVKIDFENSDFGEALPRWESGDVDAWQYSMAGNPEPGFTLRDRYLDRSQQGPLPDGFAQTIRSALAYEPGDRTRTALLEQASRVASEQALEVFICAPATQYLHTPGVVGFDEMTPPFVGGPFELRHVHFAE
ncbi:ABC transporter substrate-binding protein [Rhodococcus sp. NPDC059968]|uniref:ABC transporter substrate-binding protein n=1 Tax=Rhodococcus sp. NPDC059968 TaxID=3347017 RepID=UPI00366F1C41